MQASAAKTRMRNAHSLVCYLVMSVVASQSEPPTILDANTAQHTAKPSINGNDLIIRVTPCSPWFRRISLQRLWIASSVAGLLLADNLQIEGHRAKAMMRGRPCPLQRGH